jgi:hypothetical protein
VVELRRARELIVALPIVPDPRLAVAEGEAVVIEWPSSLGLMRHRATAARGRNHRSPTLELRLDGSPELVQRREHVRAPIQLDAVAYPPDEPDAAIPMRTLDLSGGGARLYAPEHGLTAASLVRLAIGLPEQDDLQVQARVVFASEGGEAGVMFENIAPEDQERVSQVVIDRLYELARVTSRWAD